MTIHNHPLAPLIIKDSHLFKPLGFDNPQQLRPGVRESIESEIRLALEWALPILQPQLIWTHTAIEGHTQQGLLLEENWVLACEPIRWEGCVSVILGILTLDPQLENQMNQSFQDNQPLFAMALDHIGTIALRRWGQDFFRYIEKRFTSEGIFSGPRMAPGCQDVPVIAQKMIFDCLKAQSLGMHIKPSGMMIPLKSSSFIFPMYDDLTKASERESTCLKCIHQKDCMKFDHDL